jgi:hypothetical protein
VAGISGVLGSCASCVFATKVLQEYPLPEDFLHYGDTAWFYFNLCHIRTVFHAQSCSTFHVHDYSKRQVRNADITRCVQRLAKEYRQLDPASPLPTLLENLQHARDQTDALREPHPFRFWWLNPSAWAWRGRRQWNCMKISSIAGVCKNVRG